MQDTTQTIVQAFCKPGGLFFCVAILKKSEIALLRRLVGSIGAVVISYGIGISKFTNV